MFIDLQCGKCEQSLSMESEDNDAMWGIVHRFAEAHLGCGFISPMRQVDVEVSAMNQKTVKLIQPRKFAEDD